MPAEFSLDGGKPIASRGESWRLWERASLTPMERREITISNSCENGQFSTGLLVPSARVKEKECHIQYRGFLKN